MVQLCNEESFPRNETGLKEASPTLRGENFLEPELSHSKGKDGSREEAPSSVLVPSSKARSP